MQISDAIQVTYIKALSDKKLRNTKAKQAVFTILLSASKPLSVQDIVQSAENVHYVSIYRAVDALQKAGIVRLVPQGFKNLFELSDLFQDHHHHATCDTCGKTNSIHSEDLERLMKNLSLQSGMKHTNHQFEIHGICNDCAKSAQLNEQK